MALVDNNDSEGFEAADEALLQSIRESSKPFQWGTPPNVKVVTIAEQEAERERIEEGQARALEEVQRLASEAAESAVDLEAQFSAALEGAVAEKAAAIPLLPPNPLTATRADLVRHEERVRADERAKIELAANPPEAEDSFEESGAYFDGLGGEPVESEVDEDEAEVDDLDESLYLDWAEEETAEVVES